VKNKWTIVFEYIELDCSRVGSREESSKEGSDKAERGKRARNSRELRVIERTDQTLSIKLMEEKKIQLKYFTFSSTVSAQFAIDA
jgi:hypothetical protein